jgi:uncharacterized protein (DUF433 family)
MAKGKAMNDEQLLKRIVCDPAVMTGKPVIRGTRLTVDFILNLLAHGMTEEEIRAEYPGLSKEDIQACLLFATKTLKDTDFMPLAV